MGEDYTADQTGDTDDEELYGGAAVKDVISQLTADVRQHLPRFYYLMPSSTPPIPCEGWRGFEPEQLTRGLEFIGDQVSSAVTEPLDLDSNSSEILHSLGQVGDDLATILETLGLLKAINQPTV